MKKIYYSVRKRNESIISQNEHKQSWLTPWKKRLEEISFDLLSASSIYYTHNSLGNWAENIRVLLNCLSRKERKIEHNQYTNIKRIGILIKTFIFIIFQYRIIF